MAAVPMLGSVADMESPVRFCVPVAPPWRVVDEPCVCPACGVCVGLPWAVLLPWLELPRAELL
jgi:hypothetical protein